MKVYLKSKSEVWVVFRVELCQPKRIGHTMWGGGYVCVGNLYNLEDLSYYLETGVIFFIYSSQYEDVVKVCDENNIEYESTLSSEVHTKN